MFNNNKVSMAAPRRRPEELPEGPMVQDFAG